MLTRDGLTIMTARGLRMLASGFLSVILALYLAARGFSPTEIGLVFTVALAGGAATEQDGLVALLHQPVRELVDQ